MQTQSHNKEAAVPFSEQIPTPVTDKLDSLIPF